MNCDECNQRLRRERKDYKYSESGLDDVVLVKAPVYVCPRHGVQAVALRNVAGLHAAIARALLHRRAPLRGPEIRFLRKHRRWSQEELARQLRVHPVSVARWETGATPVGAGTQQRLRLLFTDPEAFAASAVLPEQKNAPAVPPRLRVPWPTPSIRRSPRAA